MSEILLVSFKWIHASHFTGSVTHAATKCTVKWFICGFLAPTWLSVAKRLGEVTNNGSWCRVRKFDVSEEEIWLGTDACQFQFAVLVRCPQFFGDVGHSRFWHRYFKVKSDCVLSDQWRNRFLHMFLFSRSLIVLFQIEEQSESCWRVSALRIEIGILCGSGFLWFWRVSPVNQKSDDSRDVNQGKNFQSVARDKLQNANLNNPGSC